MVMHTSLPDLPIDSRSSACYLERVGGGSARLSQRGYAQDTKRNSIKEVFEEVDPEVQVVKVLS